MSPSAGGRLPAFEFVEGSEKNGELGHLVLLLFVAAVELEGRVGYPCEVQGCDFQWPYYGMLTLACSNYLPSSRILNYYGC